ncbi:MAG: hypothetical protein J6K73_15010 [Clostridia bacterium]|nr:hypothetical protein [Clostridia bacterium]
MIGTFLLGAVGYPAIELCWRGRTHPAMGLCGGICLCGLKGIHKISKNRPLWLASLLGGGMITGIEYLTGRMVNRRYRIWDYRRQPLQFRGQICLGYSLAWCGLSMVVLGIMRGMER